MRFIKYINEERQLKFFKFKEFEKNNKNVQKIKTFQKDVKPWFKYCEKQGVKNKFLWRGGSVVVKDFKKIKTRKDREPTDMCGEVHAILDDLFYNKFKVYARSQTVFCFPSYKGARQYGSKQNIILPAGNFDYIWSSNIDDLFQYIENESYYTDMCYGEDDNWDEYEIEYGADSGNGTWYYSNVDTGDSDWSSAKGEIIRDYLDDGMDIEEAEDSFNEWDMKWVPEIEFDEYIETKKKEGFNEVEILVDDYYMNQRFKDLMDNQSYRSTEIMLNCNSYYLINEDWAQKYLGYNGDY